MSLLGLLSIGRAFGTVQERPARYEHSNGWLPDFGRRREHEVAGTGGSEEVLPSVCWPERELGEPPPGHALAPAGKGGGDKTVASRRPQEVSVRREAVPASAPGRSARRSARRWGRGRASEGEWVQGELSLEGVRVVRNDLKADDLELIPLPSSALPAGFKTTMEPRPPTGGWRGWLAHWRSLVWRRPA